MVGLSPNCISMCLGEIKIIICSKREAPNMKHSRESYVFILFYFSNLSSHVLSLRVSVVACSIRLLIISQYLLYLRGKTSTGLVL
jgi:hypothetical protein